MSAHSELSVQKFIHDQGIKLMALQETGCWEPTDGFFKDKRIMRNDTTNGNNLRGVALIVDKDLLPEAIAIESTETDAVWCQIKLGNKRVLVGSVYISPSAGSDTFESLLLQLKKAKDYKEAHKFNSLLIYGDFNARNAEWGDHRTNNWGSRLLDFINQENLIFCSPFDLTFSCDGGGSVIDLIIADGPIVKDMGHQWVERDCELFTGAPSRGHYPVLHSLYNAKGHQNVKHKCTDWKRADWKNWASEVEANLWGLQLIPNILDNGQKLWEEFLQIMKEANKKHVPLKTISVHSKPYWTDSLSEILEQMLLAKEIYSKRSTPTNKEKLKQAKEMFSAELITAKNDWVRQRVEGINVQDSTQFWKKYKRVFGANSDNYIGNLTSSDSCLVTTDERKEELLYDTFFTGKHLKDLTADPNYDGEVMEHFKKIIESTDHVSTAPEEDALNRDVTEADISAAILKQDVDDKACDGDNMHPCLLKKLGPTALLTLKTIFNWCLQTGNWIWDTCRVTFIRKEGKSTYTKPESYRPLSMTSYFGKLLERIIDGRLRNYIDEEGAIDDDQEGFSVGRSTTRYLFRMLANLSDIKKQKLACIILFIDFEKAFDSVHLPTLITKLERFGIRGRLLKLLHSFLFNRKVKLKINHHMGFKRLCSLFGLPQGSVLSPFLFILYVADMTNGMPQWLKKWLSCYKFADDGTLLIAHQSGFKCFGLMQKLCNELTRWCEKNKLVINCNINKTEAIILQTGRESCFEGDQPPQLQINGKYIRYVKSTKVLGVILDENLNFKLHADQKLTECKKKWGLITKSTNRNRGLNVRSLTLLWKTMILTKLMYAAPIWLWSNMDTYKSMWNDGIMKMTGAMLNPNRTLAELTLQLPPLEILLEMQTVKFLCKVLSSEDNLTSTLLQVEGSLHSIFHQHLSSIKEYIHWRYPANFGRRKFMVDLLQLEHNGISLHYTKADIQSYQLHRWKSRIINQLKVTESTATNDQVFKLMKEQNVQLDKSTFLFKHGTSKREDSHVLDYIHGNSLLFGNCRMRMNMEDDSACYFCQEQDDGPIHQLFYCKEVQDSTHADLINAIQNPQDYIQEILLPGNRNTQRAFINRVKFLMGQHDFREESEKELISN